MEILFSYTCIGCNGWLRIFQYSFSNIQFLNFFSILVEYLHWIWGYSVWIVSELFPSISLKALERCFWRTLVPSASRIVFPSISRCPSPWCRTVRPWLFSFPILDRRRQAQFLDDVICHAAEIHFLLSLEPLWCWQTCLMCLAGVILLA